MQQLEKEVLELSKLSIDWEIRARGLELSKSVSDWIQQNLDDSNSVKKGQE